LCSIHVAIGNGRHYGGGMTVSERARIDDGRLHIYSLEVDSLWRLVRATQLCSQYTNQQTRAADSGHWRVLSCDGKW
jgi:diacylglycerol kinase family enzyme